MKLIKGVLLLDYTDLVNSYGVARGTIDCGVSKNSKGLSNSWVSIKDPEDKRKRLIVYRSIPVQSRKQLPTEQELIRICKELEAESSKITDLLNSTTH